MQLRGIKFFRKKKKLTRQEFAELIGVTRETVARYERGNRTPSIETLKKIANVLGCTVDDLLEESNEET